MENYPLSSSRIVASIAGALMLTLATASTSFAAWSTKTKLEAKVVRDESCPQLGIALIAVKGGQRYCAFGGAYNSWLNEHIGSVISVKGLATSKADPRNGNFDLPFDYIDVQGIEHAKVHKDHSAFWGTVAAFAGMPNLVPSSIPDTEDSEPPASTEPVQTSTWNTASSPRTSAQQTGSSPGNGSGSYAEPIPNCGQQTYDKGNRFTLVNRCNVKIYIRWSSVNGTIWGSSEISPAGSTWTGNGPSDVTRSGGVFLLVCPSGYQPASPTGQVIWSNTYRGSYTCRDFSH
jgi:hypothetical protein